MTTTIDGMTLCVGLMLIDFATGFLNAIMKKQVSSSIMRSGLAHKGAYLLILAAGWIIDFESHSINLGFQAPVFIPLVIAISLIEITSIMENVTLINPGIANSPIFSIFSHANNPSGIDDTPSKTDNVAVNPTPAAPSTIPDTSIAPLTTVPNVDDIVADLEKAK